MKGSPVNTGLSSSSARPAASHIYDVVSFGAGLMEGIATCGQWGGVVATFQRSCYVQSASGRMMWIAGASFDDGPLTLRVNFGCAGYSDGLGIRVGMPLWLERGDLCLGDRLRLRMSGAEPWTPPVATMQAPREAVLDALRMVADARGPVAPTEGLAPLFRYAEALSNRDTVLVHDHTPLVCAVLPAVSQIVTGLRSCDASAIDSGVGRLVGLGPGLTPSGDDFLAGMMLGLIGVLGQGTAVGGACHGASGHRWIEVLAKSILRHAINGTTAISRALLAQGCAGAGSASVHRFIQGLLEADVAQSCVASLAVARSGHTSGWDCLAGTLLGMHMALRVGEPQSLRAARCRIRDTGRREA